MESSTENNIPTDLKYDSNEIKKCRPNFIDLSGIKNCE